MTISEQDIYWFREGSHARLYEKLGAHWSPGGTRFAVWAPNAQSVSVIGDWNGWSAEAHPMQPRWDGSGLWETVIPGVQPGQPYKYRIVSRHHGYTAVSYTHLRAHETTLHPVCRLLLGKKATSTPGHITNGDARTC